MSRSEVEKMVDEILARGEGGLESAARRIDPDKAIALIESTVAEMDPRLIVSEGREVFYKGSGAEIPVSVLLLAGEGPRRLEVAIFSVTSALSVSGDVGVGKPVYTREEIRASVREGLERLTPKA